MVDGTTLALLISAGALVFNAYEYRAASRERKALARRISQERLEDVAVAVGYASDAAARQDALDMERVLSELRARAVPLSRESYPAVWKLADNTFTPDTEWTQEIRVPLREQARDAQTELRNALERLAA